MCDLRLRQDGRCRLPFLSSRTMGKHQLQGAHCYAGSCTERVDSSCGREQSAQACPKNSKSITLQVLGSARTVDEGQHADFICAFVHAHAHLNLPGVVGSAGVVVLLAAATHCRMLRMLTKGAGVRVDPARHPPWPTDVPTCACIGKFEGRIAVTILVCLRCMRGRQSQAVWHVTVVNSHS